LDEKNELLLGKNNYKWFGCKQLIEIIVLHNNI
jgi:hypothetical protein